MHNCRTCKHIGIINTDRFGQTIATCVYEMKDCVIPAAVTRVPVVIRTRHTDVLTECAIECPAYDSEARHAETP